MSASDLGGPEGEAADLETGERRVKSGAALSAAVGGNISQGGGETSLLVSLGHQGSQHRLGGALQGQTCRAPGISEGTLGWELCATRRVCSHLWDECYPVRRRGFGVRPLGMCPASV